MFASFASRKVPRVAAAFVAALMISNATADPQLQAHGFISQGYNWSTGNNFFGESQGSGSFEFTEIGLNTSARLTPRLLAAVQLVARSAGNTDEIEGIDDLDVDYALLDYRVDFGLMSYLGARVGRIKNPIGLYNDTRDAVFTRPGVLMPQPVYFDAFGLRELLLSSDGVLGYGFWSGGNHGLGLEVSITEPRDKAPGAITELTNFPGAPGELDGNPVVISRLQYDYQGGRAKAVLTHIDYRRDYQPAQDDPTPPGNFVLMYTLFSGQYNGEFWGLTAEALLLDIDRREFGSQTGKQKAAGWYLQGNWRFAPRWNAILRYDSYYANRHDRNGRERSAATGGFLPKHLFFARDAVLGVQWDVSRNWYAAAEFHHVVGTAWISVLDNPNLFGFQDPTASNIGGEKHWQLLSLMVSYRF